MFASKTPRDLNRDPEPWTDARGENRHGPIGGWSSVWSPRPEFDHVQHNEPNPILLDFRDMHGDAQLWLETIEGPEGDAFLAETPKEFGYIDSDVIHHARRVLTRLARLAEVAS